MTRAHRAPTRASSSRSARRSSPSRRGGSSPARPSSFAMTTRDSSCSCCVRIWRARSFTAASTRRLARSPTSAGPRTSGARPGAVERRGAHVLAPRLRRHVRRLGRHRGASAAPPGGGHSLRARPRPAPLRLVRISCERGRSAKYGTLGVGRRSAALWPFTRYLLPLRGIRGADDSGRPSARPAWSASRALTRAPPAERW